MARKQRCPKCGSGKVKSSPREFVCKTCGKKWSGRARKPRSRPNRTRFR